MWLPVIWFALIAAFAGSTAFVVMVVSIRRCERRKSLFDPARGGAADAFTRKVLALHVDPTGTDADRSHQALARDLVRR